MRRFVVAGALVAIGLTAAYAQSNPISERKELFKAFGASLRAVGPMMRNEAAFDGAKVQESLKIIGEGAPKVAKLFPAGSGTGDTKALPAIWTDNAKFQGLFTKLEADAKAAAAAIKDEATLKAEMPKVLANCGTCHDAFRAK